MRQDIINIALKEVGYKENPPNSNNSKYGIWFGLNKVAWCGLFASWCYNEAKHPLGVVDYSKGVAGAAFALNFYRKRNKITKTPHMSDLILYDWQLDKSPDHIGIFYRWLDEKKGIFQSIEGNTSLGNQSNGGEVMMRERIVKHVQVFIDPLGLPL